MRPPSRVDGMVPRAIHLRQRPGGIPSRSAVSFGLNRPVKYVLASLRVQLYSLYSRHSITPSMAHMQYISPHLCAQV